MKSNIFLICILGAALLGACADRTSGVSGDSPGPDQELPGDNNGDSPAAGPLDVSSPQDGVRVTPEDSVGRPPVNTRNRLEIVGDATRQMSYAGAAELRVRYVNPQGGLIRGGQVNFLFEGASADLAVGPAQSPTNRNGEATATVTTGRVSGTFRVLATAEGADPAAFTIRVEPKDRASYVVHTQYEGQTRPTLVSVRLFDDSFSCADLDPFDLLADFDHFDVIPTPQGIPSARFVNLANGDGYTAISLGLMPDSARMGYGCNDDRAPIVDGFDTEVTVVMHEILPQVAGIYDIETRVDLTDALPEPWRTNINLIGRIFADPAGLVVDLLLGDANDPNDDGLIGDVLNIIPGMRGLLTQVIEDLLDQVLSPEARQVFRVGGAVYQTLTQFTLGGQLEIIREADAQGFLATNNVHRYGSIVINWDVDCTDQDPPGCGRIELAMRDLERFGALSGLFAGELVSTEGGQDYLAIDRHSLRFNYGALLLALFEQIVLPSIFGDHVDSLGDALGEMFDCREIADGLFDPATEALLNGLLFQSCGETLGAMEDMLVELIVANSQEIPNLTFGTFEATSDADFARLGCPIDEPTPYPQGVTRRRYDAIGTEQARCGWDARLETSGELRQIDADFYGGR